jgi:hypothetical protein
MACFHPRSMWPSKAGGRWTFSPADAVPGAESVEVGCYNCQGCMAARTAQWTERNLWEFNSHDQVGCFVTLTFEDEHLPESYSVDIRTLQLFLKRLRKRLWKSFAIRIRFFAVAEYGEAEGRTKRPHYHVLVYGWRPQDAEQIENAQSGLPQWQSALLSEVWGQGRVVVGDVTPQSISYCAGYIFDKRHGERAKEEYSDRLHPVTGQLCTVRPPFNVMSRKPGIGMCWYDQHRDDDAKGTFVVRDGRKRAMPRAIVRRRIADMGSDAEREAFRAERRAAAAAEAEKRRTDNTTGRRLVREVVKVLKAQALARGDTTWTPEHIAEQLHRAGEFDRIDAIRAGETPEFFAERRAAIAKLLRAGIPRLFGTWPLRDFTCCPASCIKSHATKRREHRIAMQRHRRAVRHLRSLRAVFARREVAA